jgi:SHS2 domain-containing protein
MNRTIGFIYTRYVAQVGIHEIDHTADWAIRVVAETLPQLFEFAARGMFSIAGIQVSRKPWSPEELHLEANDIESLLVLWLEELLYRIESTNTGVTELTIQKIDPSSLAAEIVPSEILSIGRDIKAVTYHNLEIIRRGDRWIVEIVFDV